MITRTQKISRVTADLPVGHHIVSDFYMLDSFYMVLTRVAADFDQETGKLIELRLTGRRYRERASGPPVPAPRNRTDIETWRARRHEIEQVAGIVEEMSQATGPSGHGSWR